MSEFGIQNLFNPVAPKEGRMSRMSGHRVGRRVGLHQRRGGNLTREGGVEGVSPEVAVPKEGGEGDTKYPQPGEKGKETERCKRKLAAPPQGPQLPHPRSQPPLQFKCYQHSLLSLPAKIQGILEVPNHGDFLEGSSSLFYIWAL